jgi:hypothetical protein
MGIEIKEFLLGNYFIFFYALGLITSIVTYRQYYDSILKYLPIIIAYTLATETLGLIIRENNEMRLVLADEYAHYNILIFNIFDIIFFLYFFYVFRSVITNLRFRNWITYSALLFIIISLVNPFFQNLMLFPQMTASTVGSLALVMITIFYLIESKSERKTRLHSLLFWVSLGLLIFYIFYPFIILVGYFDYELYLRLHVRTILHILIAVMYSCFIIGFLSIKRVRPEEM